MVYSAEDARQGTVLLIFAAMSRAGSQGVLVGLGSKTQYLGRREPWEA